MLSIAGLLGTVAALVYNLVEGSIAFLPWAWIMPVGFALTTQGSWNLLRTRPQEDPANDAL